MRQLPPELLLLLTAAIWGSSYSVAKTALGFYPVAGVIAVRFLLTATLLLPYWLRLPAAQRRATLGAGLPTGLGLLAIFLAETSGVALTGAGNAAFLISLCLLLTPPLEWLWLGKRPAGKLWLAALLSLGGIWLLTGMHRGTLGNGDALMLLAALIRAVVSCLTSRLTAGKALDTLGLTATQALVVGTGALLLAPWLPGGLPPLPGAAGFWVAELYMTSCCTLFAFWAMNRALAASSPSKVALLLGSEPLWGALFAVLWLGESLGRNGWLGGLLIVATTVWLAWPVRQGAHGAA